jgi:hypothetical protein
MRAFTTFSGLLVGILLLIVGGVNIGAAADQVIRVTPLTRDGQVFVSFEADAAIDRELEQTIQSGLPTTFTYDVELGRASALWFDRSVASATIAATVRYDNLTRRYNVYLLQDGRVLETHPTDSATAVTQLVSNFHRLPLFSTRQLQANTEYYVRVRGRTRPRRSWAVLLWDRPSAFGSAKFTFLG